MFFSIKIKQQADLIWQTLFVDRTPISEASRGVITVLNELGLSTIRTMENLDNIRKMVFKQDPNTHVENVFQKAGVKYAIMTNIPFDVNEAQHWMPIKKIFSTFSFSTSCRSISFWRLENDKICCRAKWKRTNYSRYSQLLE